METLFFLIWLVLVIAATAEESCVESAKEDANFTDFVNMVNQNIVASQTYKIPKDNSALVQLRKHVYVKSLGRYDFIVIGSGAAGAVIANRLSENPEWKVLLLEAGGEDNDFSKIYGLRSYMLRSSFNWGYKTVPQKNACVGCLNKQCHFTQGKVLGGSTTINAGIYARGHFKDYDRWGTVYNNTGWSFSEALRYFKKSENAVFDRADNLYHGEGGPFTVNKTIQSSVPEHTFIQGFEELDQISTNDYNAYKSNGIGNPQIAIKCNERVSSARAFLHNLNRTNLDISVNSYVTKILIDRRDKAYDVTFVKRGWIYHARVKKEAIVSAGAINSAQILMLSGIGPKAHLSKLNIEVRSNVPVGKKFQDHVMFVGFYFRCNKPILFSRNLTEELKLYVRNEGSLVSSVNGMMAFTNLKGSQQRRPEIEFTIIAPGLPSATAQLAFGLNDKYTAVINKTNASTDIFVGTVLLHPKSRGTVTLKSKSPKDRPNIDPNYLAEPEDIETIYKGIKFLIALNNTKAFKKFGAEMVVFDYPNCEDFKKLSKEWWTCAIRHMSVTCYHGVATNQMGPDKTTSVVNERLKVHGIKGLRVADSSVIPETISGHPMATTMMIGEKAADMIREDWEQPSS